MKLKVLSKAQIMEIFGFLAIVAISVFLLIALRIYLLGGFYQSLKNVQEEYELEYTKAGLVAILRATDDNTKMRIGTLLGIAAYLGNDTFTIREDAPPVNVSELLKNKFDLIFGENKWYYKMPIPKIYLPLEIVAVSDTSASMCDELKIIAENVTQLPEELLEKGYEVYITLYSLGSWGSCSGCDFYNDAINKLKDNPPYFYYEEIDIHSNECPLLSGSRDEDWTHGLSCAIMKGPKKGAHGYGWDPWPFSVRVAIALSDEMPGGSENNCNNCPSCISYKDTLVQNATDMHVRIFTFRGKIICQSGDICYSYVGNQLMYCTCNEGPLKDLMEEISNQTGGREYFIENVSQIIPALVEIIETTQPPRKKLLEGGTKEIPAFEKNIRAITFVVSNPIKRDTLTYFYFYRWV